MSIPKRPPLDFGGEHQPRYAALSKADWADAYADLYRQAFGEDAPAADILADAEHRHGLLEAIDLAERA